MSDTLISVIQVCECYELEQNFVDELQQHGLIEIVFENNTPFVEEKELSSLEKIMRLYRDLGINMAGIDAIFNLLDKLEITKNELLATKGKLSLYE